MTDDLDRELERLDRERERLIFERTVRKSAEELGFRDVADAARLLDASAIEREPDGTPKDVKRHLRRLLDEKSYLADPTRRATGSGDGGRGNRAVPPATDMNALLRRAVGRE